MFFIRHNTVRAKKERWFNVSILSMLLSVLIVLSGVLSGCALGSSDMQRNKGKEEALMDSIINQYNSENKASIKSEDVEVLAVKALGSNYLVLCSYEVKTEKELVLLEVSKKGAKYKVVNEAHGAFAKDLPSVCSIEYKDAVIYFGNIPKNNEEAYSAICAELDDGTVIKEPVNENDKGYIFSGTSNTSIVNYSFHKSNGKVHYFIKDFINYGYGIYECVWSQPR